MSDAIQFHLDENVDPAIADGLRRRGISVTTTRDAGLVGARDGRKSKTHNFHQGFSLARRPGRLNNSSEGFDAVRKGVPTAGGAGCFWAPSGLKYRCGNTNHARLTVRQRKTRTPRGTRLAEHASRNTPRGRGQRKTRTTRVFRVPSTEVTHPSVVMPGENNNSSILRNRVIVYVSCRRWGAESK